MIDISELELSIKQLIIECLELEDMDPGDIVSDAPLFGDGLGLDSIDALELGMALQARYGVTIDAEDEATKDHFFSVQSLATFVNDSKSRNEEQQS